MRALAAQLILKTLWSFEAGGGARIPSNGRCRLESRSSVSVEIVNVAIGMRLKSCAISNVNQTSAIRPFWILRML